MHILNKTKKALKGPRMANDFVIDHETNTAWMWATTPQEMVEMTMLLMGNIVAGGFRLEQHIQPNRPDDMPV
jgi:hypothetical protein